MKDMPWFKFRKSWLELFHKMSREEENRLLDCIDAYLSETELPELQEKLEYVWLLIKQDLAVDLAQVKNAREGQCSTGRKRGRPRKTVQPDPATENDPPVSENNNDCVRVREGDAEINKNINGNIEINKEKEIDKEIELIKETDSEEDKDTAENKKLEREQETVDITPSLCPPKGDKGRFEQFWAAYPRKDGKADARKAFAKLKVTDEKLTMLLDALARQRRSDQWTRENGRYIPYASTWLNGARWEDAEPEISRPMNPFLEMLYAERGETV